MGFRAEGVDAVGVYFSAFLRVYILEESILVGFQADSVDAEGVYFDSCLSKGCGC